MYVINCRHLDRFTYHNIIFRNNCTLHRFELFLSILKFVYSINHIYIFVLDQSRLYSIITLWLAALDKSHTASYISEKFEDTLNFWEISKDTIIAVITDHANNMVRAVKDSFGHDKALQCYALCLNLLVEQALEDSPNISVIINKEKKL